MKRPVSSLSEGAQGRFGDIFRRCSPDLHRYVQRRLRGSPDTADLIQEIFERLIRVDWSEMARNPQAYLFGIASNVVADARIAEEKQAQAVMFDSEMVEKAGETLPSDDFHVSQSIALEDELLSALERLPNAHRLAIVMTKRDGLSCKEAALRMGTTEGSVRVYVCEARAQLKMLLKQAKG